jgi:hypothetical protein
MKIFEDNPQLDHVFKTSDEQFFLTENAAKNHAETLIEGSWEKIIRPVVEVLEMVEGIAQAIADGADALQDAISPAHDASPEAEAKNKKNK